MTTQAHDVTDVFWPFINMAASLPYDVMKHTDVYSIFHQLSDSTLAFRIKMSEVQDENFDMAVFNLDKPYGVWVDGKWMYYSDINRLFWGMHEIYMKQPKTVKRRNIIKAMDAISMYCAVQEAAAATAAEGDAV
jgi:hypothetical protein